MHVCVTRAGGVDRPPNRQESEVETKRMPCADGLIDFDKPQHKKAKWSLGQVKKKSSTTLTSDSITRRGGGKHSHTSPHRTAPHSIVKPSHSNSATALIRGANRLSVSVDPCVRPTTQPATKTKNEKTPSQNKKKTKKFQRPTTHTQQKTASYTEGCVQRQTKTCTSTPAPILFFW